LTAGAIPLLPGDYYALEAPPLDAVYYYKTAVGDNLYSARY
jgi:hypothetical protein